MLKIKSLETYYGNLKVLKNVSLHIKKGEIVTIIGANGAGKSTLLKTISGLIKAKSGDILFKDKKINSIAADKITTLGCVHIPEGRQLFNTMTVKENLVLGSFFYYKSKNKKEIFDKIEYIYELFPILNKRSSQLAGTLSGGEQQMLAVGRALMTNPELLMLDEPSMGLAPLIVKEIFNILIKLKEKNITILLVEQNAKSALSIADRAYVMETGQIILEGSSNDLLNNNEVQRAYLGKEYKEISER